ncbi:hypothetical protein TRFO_13010 [Tritrichomonas foetus]|uniref:Uncharacterized protein n=1 Tax=Tritrichomonas foetus TaxID=1144522 RepID=A0A1J4L001_9EUKA|nr:hypothetical protein TRFO_13010 [Tritrichomonas foetus]|eukprot:OHT16738.1 hypothetical protein TRFO_13010 [Tritrichomonas foetus]
MSSIIKDLLIADLIHPLNEIANQIIQKINSSSSMTSDSLFSYLKGFFEDTTKISTIIHNISLVGSQNILNAIQEFFLAMPKFDVNSKSPPSGDQKVIIYLTKPDWSNELIQYSIALFFDVVISTFCLKLIENNKKQTSNNLETIFTQIEAIIETNTDNPTFNKFKTISAPIWASFIFYLSKLSESQNIYNKVSHFVTNFSKNSDDKKALYLTLYSKIYFRNVKYDSLHKDLKKNLVSIIKNANNKKVKLNHELHNSSYQFIMNFVGNLCLSDSAFQKSDTLNNILKETVSCVSDKNYLGSAYECLAVIVNFIEKKDFKINKYIDILLHQVSSPIHSYYIIQSLNALLRGKNYLGIYDHGEMFKGPRTITEPEIINTIFNKVYDNSGNFSPHQAFLTEFISQIAVADIKSFISDKLPNKIFKSNSHFLMNNGGAVFDAARIFVHSDYHFPINDNNRDALIQIIQNQSLKLAAQADPTQTNNWKNIAVNLKVFNVKSFVESVISHNEDLNTAFFYNQIESEPKIFMPLAEKKISSFVTRWKKLFPSDFSSNSIFKANEHPIQTFNEDIVNDTVLPSAICIIPLAAPDCMTIDDLATNIFSESVAVSAAAIRAVQALIHIDKTAEIVKSVLEKTDFLISKNTFASNEAMYRSLQAMKLTLESLIYTKASIAEEFIKFFNIAAIIGLCSSTYEIRMLGLNIAGSLEGKTIKKSVSTVFNDFEEEISFLTKIDSLSAISYRNYSCSDTTSIKAHDLLQSNYDVLYMFEIAAYSYELRKHFDDADIGGIRAKIIEVLKASSIEIIDDLFLINICVFLYNTCSKSEYASLADVYTILKGVMGKNKDYGNWPYYALVAEIDPDVLLKLIFKTKDLKLYLPLLFSLRRKFDDKTIKISNDNISPLLGFLEKIFVVFYDYGIKHQELSFASLKFTYEQEQSLISFLQFSKILFDYLYENNQINPIGPFVRTPIFEMHEKIDINPKYWFFIVSNIASLNTPLGIEARKTLISFFHVFKFPDSHINKFIENTELFESDPAIICGFLQYSPNRIPKAISNASTNYNYFLAISLLFRDFTTIDEFLKTSEKCLISKPKVADNVFYNIIYKSAGSLLALSFNYILLDDGECRAAGFRLLQCIALGLSVSRKNVSAKLCHRIDELRPHIITSQHANTGVEACASLSNVLAQEFSFLSEQFVCTLLPLAAKEKNLAYIILPWIKKVRLSNSSEMVLTLTDPIFESFTTFKFIQMLIMLPASVAVLQMISQAVKEQAEDSIDVIEFILITILTSPLTKQEDKNRYETIIVFLYTLNSTQVLEILFQILEYDFWHYHQVQINRMDALFDISKFLSDLSAANSSAGNTRSNSTIDKLTEGENDEDDDIYNTTVVFVLGILRICLNEKIDPFNEFLPDLILFSFINITKYSQNCQQILTIILPFDESNDEQLSDYISNLNTDIKKRLSIKSLAWGLCCGELDIALNGLAFFHFVGLDVDNNTVDAILEVFYVISKCLYERTRKIQNNSTMEKQWLLHILDINKEPDKKSASLYLATLLDILLTAKPREDVFWTVVSVFNLNGEEYTPILNSAIRLIAKMLSSSEFSRKISQSEMPKGFNGLIPLISKCVFDRYTAPIFFDLFKVIKRDVPRIGYSGENSTQLYNIIESISQVIELEKSQPLISASDICEYDVSIFDIVLSLLTQIILQMKGNHLTIIYEMCAQIIGTNVTDKAVSDLACAVNTDKQYSNFFSMNQLMKVVNEHGCSISSPALLNRSKFPEIHFAKKYSFDETRITNKVSVFTDVKTFPPPLLADTGFMMCPIVASVKTNVEQVLAQPFSEWSELMFKCESAEVKVDSKSLMDEQTFSIEQVERNKFQKWTHEIALYVDEDDDKLVLYKYQQPKQAAGTKKAEVAHSSRFVDSLDTINTKLFLPEVNSIEFLGKDTTFKGFNMPFIFPA